MKIKGVFAICPKQHLDDVVGGGKGGRGAAITESGDYVRVRYAHLLIVGGTGRAKRHIYPIKYCKA